jgi:hypothetical protein
MAFIMQIMRFRLLKYYVDLFPALQNSKSGPSAVLFVNPGIKDKAFT